MEKEQEKIRNFGVTAPISDRIRKQLAIEEKQREHYAKLRRISLLYGIAKPFEPEPPPYDQCPQCEARMDEDWEDERDEFGELTGFSFEIFSCSKCGHSERI